MLLYYTPASPFARKARIVVREHGLKPAVHEMVVAPYGDDPALLQANPLGQVPTLVLSDGQVLFDSTVIAAYLDTAGTGPRLLPESGLQRWRVLTHAALADTVMALAVSGVMERKRPAHQQSADAMARAFGKIERALGALERYATEGRPWNMAHVSSACALGYLNFRYGDYPWRAKHPQLWRWLDSAEQRPALMATVPQEAARPLSAEATIDFGAHQTACG